MSVQKNSSVQQKFETYPANISIFLYFYISILLHNLRDLILNVRMLCSISDITKTLKWGDPRYISKIGSTIIFGW